MLPTLSTGETEGLVITPPQDFHQPYNEACEILRGLLDDAVRQAGPGHKDLDVDFAELADVCHQARAFLYKYTGRV